MLFVERSNRTEALLDGLTARLTHPVERPLAPAVVVVQGRGMERWIAQSVAERTGVCAGVEFLFPRGLLEWIFDRAERLLGDDDSWDTGGWPVLKNLTISTSSGS